jgi:hypothetical protein
MSFGRKPQQKRKLFKRRAEIWPKRRACRRKISS